MNTIPTDHPGNYTLVTTTVWLDHAELPPLPDWYGKDMRVESVIITWRWSNRGGWVCHGIEVCGTVLRKDKTLTARSTSRRQLPGAPVAALPPEYDALMESNRPTWIPLPV
ncbi:hypothetical protein [Streptosporangium sandarakinum]|uniref:hypothetical protein n=1 Tax=Streptosporangium sandarakinum TaxID=1260955 RepID=UPI0036C74FCE